MRSRPRVEGRSFRSNWWRWTDSNVSRLPALAVSWWRSCPRARRLAVEKRFLRSLFPFPMIFASFLSKFTSLRLRERTSEIRAPVPRSPSTRARNRSWGSGTSLQRSLDGMIASKNWPTSSLVRYTTSRLGIRAGYGPAEDSAPVSEGPRAKLQEGPQRIENGGHPCLPTAALLHFPPQA